MDVLSPTRTGVATMTVRIFSFGFKYGFPAEADIVLDVRCLPNPFYEDDLRPLTGNDAVIQEYVLQSADAVAYLHHIVALLTHAIPMYQKKGREQLTVAIGCTGGKHRSVTVVNRLADALGHLTDCPILTEHRDMGRE